MKTMKLWRIAFMMLAAFSLTSCSSDDNEEFLMDQQKGMCSTRLRLASRPQWVNVPFMCMMSLQATRHL